MSIGALLMLRILIIQFLFFFALCGLMGFEENDFENKSNFHQSDEIANKSFLMLATHACERC